MNPNDPPERSVGGEASKTADTPKMAQPPKWRRRVKNWLARNPPNPNPATTFARGKSLGKWIAGISGIAIVVACSLVISSYAEFEATPEKCLTLMFAADGIRGGFKYACLFAVSGLFGLFASIIQLPSTMGFASIKKAEDRRSALLTLAIPVFLLILLAVALNVFHLSVKNLSKYEVTVEDRCKPQHPFS